MPVLAYRAWISAESNDLASDTMLTRVEFYFCRLGVLFFLLRIL